MENNDTDNDDTTGSGLDRRHYLKALGGGATALGLGATSTASLAQTGDSGSDLPDPSSATIKRGPPPSGWSEGVPDPLHFGETGEIRRKPATKQVQGMGQQVQRKSYDTRSAMGEESMMGHEIEQISDPADDVEAALEELEAASEAGDEDAMEELAEEIEAILTGKTEGRIYDGFPLLNYNMEGRTDEHVDGEYKMKKLKKTDRTTTDTIDGQERPIWEMTINEFWHGQKFHADTFLMVAPEEMDQRRDPIEVNFRFYSMIDEEFAPTSTLRGTPNGPLQLPYMGMDSVWSLVHSENVTEMTVRLPPPQMVIVFYKWGWRIHPARVQAVHPVHELVNEHTGEVELSPEGRNHATRWREAGTIDQIGDAAGEKKMYNVATAILEDDASPEEVHAMLTEEDTDPRFHWEQWVDVSRDQRQVPPEALEHLQEEGVDVDLDDNKLENADPDEFPYRMVVTYMNNELYGCGPLHPSIIEAWDAGDQFQTKPINLDGHKHYYRVVDFNTQLNDAMGAILGAGDHSFEMFNLKPAYGIPKAAEMQYRAGWGFHPHRGTHQQWDVWARPCEDDALTPFFDEDNEAKMGYMFSEEYRRGATREEDPDRPDGIGPGEATEFRFNPPPHIIGSREEPADYPLREPDGSEGIIMGSRTETAGVAKMCSHDDHPPGEFCTNDVSQFHPGNPKNADTDGDGEPDALHFPPFLRNPDPEGGDMIPPTPVWKPFLWFNPEDGTLADPENPEEDYWVDKTYAHGRPIAPGESITATIEQPREAGQVFYQFDPLFHDTIIYPAHPLTREELEVENWIDSFDPVVAESEIVQHNSGKELFVHQEEDPIEQSRLRRKGDQTTVDSRLSVEQTHSTCEDRN